jgi:hypothetical protein
MLDLLRPYAPAGDDVAQADRRQDAGVLSGLVGIHFDADLLNGHSYLGQDRHHVHSRAPVSAISRISIGVFRPAALRCPDGKCVF